MMRRIQIGIAVTLAVAGAAVADRFEPARPPTPVASRPSDPGGVWGCPVVKIAGLGGWLHLVNSGGAPSSVRVIFVADGRKPIEQALRLGAGQAATLGTPGALLPASAGAVVEYAGGAVTVSRTVLLSGPGFTGAGAASCARPGSDTLVVPQGSTLKTEMQLELLNPSSEDAIVDVGLSVGGRRLAPVSLRGRVVPARQRRVIRVGDFAFDAKAVAAVVTARAGHVVADAIIASTRLVDLAPAIPATRRLVALANSSRGAASFAALAIGDADAVTEGHVLTLAGGTTFQPLVTGLAPDAPLFAGPPASGVRTGPLALEVRSTTSAIATGARWSIGVRGGSVETAISTGVAPARQAVGVIGAPASARDVRLFLANPDPSDATVDVAVLTESGPAPAAEVHGVTIRAGSTSAFALRGLPSSATVGVVVSATGGNIAAVLEATASLPGGRFCAYAVTAVPATDAPAVAVIQDARLGVPAR